MTNKDFQCSHGCADQDEHDVWSEDMLIGAIDASGPNAAQIQAALTRGDLDKAQKILARIQGRRPVSIIINPPNTSTGVGKQIVELIDRMQKRESRYPSATYRHRWTESEPDYLGNLARAIGEVGGACHQGSIACHLCGNYNGRGGGRAWSERVTCPDCTPLATKMTRLQRVAVGLEADPYPHLGGFSNDCEAAEARGWYENHLRPGNEREAHRRDLDRRSWDRDLPSDDFSGDDVCRYVGPEKR